jgi:hypothetical protein
MQCGAAKYVDGVALVGEDVVTRAFAFDDLPQKSKIRAENQERLPSQPVLSDAGVSALTK